MNMANRWWTYQAERFPVVKHGVLIAVFAASAVCYSVQARGGGQGLPVGAIALAVITLFLFFVQLRIADEFKDFEDDARYRPYRPVPRGLVTLRELGIVAIAAAVVQLGLAVSVGRELVLLLLLVWGYMVLMRNEFFAPVWLRSHPVIYLISHMLIMPLMTGYATACDWLAAGVAPSRSLVWLLLMSLMNGAAIEIGRKIRAPHDEEPGVETYTALWGRQRAVAAWLSAVWGTGLAVLMAAWQIQLVSAAALVVLVLLTVSMVVAWRFLAYPVTAWAQGFETMAGLWTLLAYLAIGLVPVLVRPTLV